MSPNKVSFVLLKCSKLSFQIPLPGVTAWDQLRESHLCPDDRVFKMLTSDVVSLKQLCNRQTLLSNLDLVLKKQGWNAC